MWGRPPLLASGAGGGLAADPGRLASGARPFLSVPDPMSPCVGLWVTCPCRRCPPARRGCGPLLTSAASPARSEGERLQFMRGLQAVWSVHGRRVMAAFDLSPFPVVCDLGGESRVPMSALRSGPVWAVPQPKGGLHP